MTFDDDHRLDADDDFFAGRNDDLAEFEVPDEKLEIHPGRLPYYVPDEAGIRLRRFAQRIPPFDWVNDPRVRFWNQALAKLGEGRPTEPIEGDTNELWQLLLAVVRAERFTDGLVAVHAVALTRIANEIRRRLVRERRADRGGPGC